MDKVIEVLIDDLGLAFRHVFPGVLVLAALIERYPHRFSTLNVNQINHLLVLGIAALVVGNAAVFINRYICLQGLDWCFWWLRIRGVAPTTGAAVSSYQTFVADEVKRFYANGCDQLRRHIRFREAASLFLMVVGEVAVLPMLACPFGMYVTVLRLLLGCTAIAGGVMHFLLTRAITRQLFPCRKGE